jgi:hypothetical protein
MTLVAAAACSSAPTEPAPEPKTAAATIEPFTLPDLDGNEIDPLDAGQGASVFVFARTDCPISNRYAPEVRKIQEKFAPRGVGFWLVYLDRDQGVDEVRAHMAEYGYPFGAVLDLDHELVRLTGAKVTPEAAVFAGGELMYRGRIDDRYVDFGKARAEPTVHDLDEALEAVLAGRPVPNATTPAVGCFIPDLQ